MKLIKDCSLLIKYFKSTFYSSELWQLEKNTKHNKIKKLLANVSLFIIQHLQNNLNECARYVMYVLFTNNGLILQKYL